MLYSLPLSSKYFLIYIYIYGKYFLLFCDLPFLVIHSIFCCWLEAWCYFFTFTHALFRKVYSLISEYPEISYLSFCFGLLAQFHCHQRKSSELLQFFKIYLGMLKFPTVRVDLNFSPLVLSVFALFILRLCYYVCTKLDWNFFFIKLIPLLLGNIIQ